MNRPRYGFLYSVTFLLALFEATLSDQFAISTIHPEIVYAIPVFWALQARPDEVTFHAWTAGLLKDLFSLSPLGTYGVLFALAAFLLCKIRVYLYRDSIITLLLVSFLFELSVNGLHGFAYFLTGANLTIYGIIASTIFTSLYSCLPATLLLKPMIQHEQQLGFYHLQSGKLSY